MAEGRLNTVLDAIDAANARDPTRVIVDGEERAAELAYGRRMSQALERLYPGASEHLQIATRGQHIERWTTPRREYPMDRSGYLRWRTDLARYHAKRVGEIMAAAGYSTDDVSRVKSLLRKHRLKRNPEVQALEDVICIVFLENYFADFAAKHDRSKVVDILRKTWSKMSPHGQEAALRLSLPEDARSLVETALAEETKAHDAPGG